MNNLVNPLVRNAELPRKLSLRDASSVSGRIVVSRCLMVSEESGGAVK